MDEHESTQMTDERAVTLIHFGATPRQVEVAVRLGRRGILTLSDAINVPAPSIVGLARHWGLIEAPEP